MKKKKLELSAQDKQVKKNVKHIPDYKIDFSDIPESTDDELKMARRVGRPKSGKPWKQLIAIRIDPRLLGQLRNLAKKRHKPYQTYIHSLLEKSVKKEAA